MRKTETWNIRGLNGIRKNGIRDIEGHEKEGKREATYIAMDTC